jgi:hypothetical protein
MGLDYTIFHQCGLDPARHVFIGGNHDDYTLEVREDVSPDDPALLAPESKLTLIEPDENFFIPEKEKYGIHLKSCLPYFEEPTVCEYSRMPPNALGDYGLWQVPDTDHKIFYVRGAWSIDGEYRRRQQAASDGIWWYPREQMSVPECNAAIEFYEKEKPEVVVSHAAPTMILKNLRLVFSGGEIIATNTGRMLDLMWKIHQPKLWVFAHYHQFWEGVIDKTHFICLNQFAREGWTLDMDRDLHLLGVDLWETGDDPYHPHYKSVDKSVEECHGENREEGEAETSS